MKLPYIDVSSWITIEDSTICLPSMAGYPEYIHRGIRVLEDGYELSFINRDFNGNITERKTLHIDKGFFANASLQEIAIKLDCVGGYHSTTANNILQNAKLVELIAYDAAEFHSQSESEINP